jgi:phosphinothricin acetyltransferase
MNIIPFSEAHYPQVAKIYLQGITTGQATFQTEVPNWKDWDRGTFATLSYSRS